MADQFGFIFTAVAKLYVDLIRTVDHVIVGQHVAFSSINNDARTQAFKWLWLTVSARHLAEKTLQRFRNILSLRTGIGAFHVNTDHGR